MGMRLSSIAHLSTSRYEIQWWWDVSDQSDPLQHQLIDVRQVKKKKKKKNFRSSENQ